MIEVHSGVDGLVKIEVINALIEKNKYAKEHKHPTVNLLDRVNVGIIGCGYQGTNHALSYEKVPEARIVAVADVRMENAKSFARRFNAEYCYTDYRDLLNNKEVDAVSIVIPTHLHKEVAIASVKAGKCVLCEKPLTLTLKDAEELAKEVKKTDVIFQYAENVRFAPSMVKAKELLESGEIGTPMRFYTRWKLSPYYRPEAKWLLTPSESGGILLESAIHVLDLSRYFFGEPERIYAEMYTALLMDTYGDVLDTIWIIVKFRNNVTATIESGATMYMPSEKGFWKYQWSIANIVGDKGEMLSDIYNTLTLWKHREPSRHWLISGAGYEEEVRHFINCVITGNPPAIGVDDGVAALKMAFMARQASREGRAIAWSRT